VSALPSEVRAAAEAALSKKAEDVVVLDVHEDSGFTDYFVLASGGNQKQLVAIVDAIEASLRQQRVRPAHVEGYPRQEWVLMDYGGFVVHVFTHGTREFYGLERLWGGAGRVEIS
jgi:ribosome-associated protein